jgi:WD40 repeat protein
LEFLPDNRLLAVGDGGLRLWDIDTGASEVLAQSNVESRLAVFAGGRQAAHILPDWSAQITDLNSRTSWPLLSHGSDLWPIAVDSEKGIIVTGGGDGTVRVGPLSGAEPHLLFGHEGLVRSVAISPDGQYIASVGDDRFVRLWPMPDLTKPPLHTLPHRDLLTKLRSLTNLRAIRNPTATAGWSLEIGAFRGWEEVPEW